MSTYRNLITLCAAAVFALGLAACSSGGDAPATDGTDIMEPTPRPTAMVTIPDAMYLDEDNAPMAGTTMISAGEMATNNGVIFMCPAGGDDCEVTVAADGSATSTGGAATATLSADAMVQVAQAKQAAQDEADRAALENRDRIIGKDRAIEAAANLPLTGDGATEAGIIITRAGSGPARVSSSGYSPADDSALPNGDVWAGSRLVQTDGGNTNHLFVYTDKEPATRIQFYNWDGDAATPALYSGTGLDDATTPATTATVIPGLALTGDATGNFSEAVADLTRFPAGGPVEEGDILQTYQVNDATTPGGTIDRVSIPGNFNGAGGRYNCAPDAGVCSVSTTPAGVYTLVGTWTFVPELNATAWIQDGGTAAVGGQQGEFMSFGWWLQEPTAQTGPYTFRYYADGSAYATDTNVLRAGSATYNGRAAGKYVVQEIDETGVVDGKAGMFVAAASLTATFTGTGSAGSISGTISGFQGEHEEVSDWSVTLNSRTLATADGSTSSANLDPDAATFDGATATLGDETLYGSWSSQFFGQPAGNAYPLGVGGTFQADNEAASIGGAFGARR